MEIGVWDESYYMKHVTIYGVVLMVDLTEKAIDVAQKYLDNIVDAPSSELGGILTDQVKFWRWKNKINTLQKAKKFLEDKGISPDKAKPDIVLPLLDVAADTEDVLLSDMFAALLASHLTPGLAHTVHPSYSRVLSQLSDLDAFVINDMYKGSIHAGATYNGKCLPLEIAVRDLGVSEDILLLTFQNLWRLGICDHGPGLGHLNNVQQLVFTPYGWAFMQKCSH